MSKEELVALLKDSLHLDLKTTGGCYGESERLEVKLSLVLDDGEKVELASDWVYING